MLDTFDRNVESLHVHTCRCTRHNATYVFCMFLLVSSSLLLLLTFWLSDGDGDGDGESALMPFNTIKASAPRNVSLAHTLEHEVRVLCWVMTMPKNHKTRAAHIKRTWGKRCTRLLFVSTEPDDELDTITVPIVEDYWHLWAKTRSAFAYVYQHHRDEADWFLKADDDTYVFMENLRYMLYPYSPEIPIFFGYNYHLHQQRNVCYMSGGSGYVLSREAVRRFVGIGLPDPEKCKPPDRRAAEDVEVGACLYSVGVIAGDSRDLSRNHRFCPFQPFTMLHTDYLNYNDWFLEYSYYRIRACRDCLSKYAVSFHYIAPAELYVYEYFAYHFELFGSQQTEQTAIELPHKLYWDELVIAEGNNPFAKIV